MAKQNIDAKQLEAVVEKLPKHEQVALALMHDNVLKGSTWAVETNADVVRECAEVFKQHQDLFRVYFLEGIGILAETHLAVFEGILGKFSEERKNRLTLEYSNSRRTALETLEKVVLRAIKERKTKGSTFEIGIYSVNGENWATDKSGNRIRAFQLNFEDTANALVEISNKTGVEFELQLTQNDFVSARGLGTIPNFQKLNGVVTTRDNNALVIRVTMR